MTLTLVPGPLFNHAGLYVDIVAPVGQLSTASTVVLAGAELDARGFRSLAYTVKVATQSVDWSVFGANASDYSDEVAVQAATTVVAGAAGSYVVAQAPYSFYRCKLIDTVGGVHGTATIRGILKG